MRNKRAVLFISGISGMATGIIVSLNIPFIWQGLIYPSSPAEIIVSLCLTFTVSVVLFILVAAGWLMISEMYYTCTAGLNELSEMSEGIYNERK